MEYCTLDDAFPAPSPASGCRGSESTQTQRKEERKRAKRCKGPQLNYLESNLDPDRQALGAGVPSPMRGSGAMGGAGSVNPYNPATGLTEHAPLTAEPIGQKIDDIIASVPRSAYMARRPPSNTVAAHVKLRETEGPRTLISSASAQPPSYFGADPLDGPEPKGSLAFTTSGSGLDGESETEGYANYNPMDDDQFTLQPNFATTFGQTSENKASGTSLPIPSIVDAWKRLTPSGANTAFIEYLPPPGGELMPLPSQGLNPVEYVVGQQNGQQYAQNDMKRRFDEIFSRLDDLENKMTSGSENTQMELFLFILSGMFVMFSIDMFARR